MISFTTLSGEKKVTGDRWHIISDTWHVTCGGRWNFFQNFISLALLVWEWRFDEDILTNLDSMNYVAVYRTAPTTPGRLKLYVYFFVQCAPNGRMSHSRWDLASIHTDLSLTALNKLLLSALKKFWINFGTKSKLRHTAFWISIKKLRFVILFFPSDSFKSLKITKFWPFLTEVKYVSLTLS